ncbi:MAG: tetratricopeptide repeat protein [Myxococcales bacterium]|nr:tetratricopeptide repeat protein [Myxococcales bacterium]MDH3844643.1 tetratricopeptide repeat protein [Myxococcales bacterium]
MNEGSDRDNVIRVGFGADGKLTRTATPEPAPAPAPSQAASPALDPTAGLYTVTEVARLFGYTPSRLRYWHRSGLLEPSARVGGRNYYTFQDLIGVRAAKGLLEQGVPLRQVRRTVESLRNSLPKTTQPLSEVRVLADGRTVLVQDDAGTYEPTTGQAVLDFTIDGLESDVVRMLRAEGDDRSRAYEYYLEGCRLDELAGTFEQAEEAYQKALSLDPTLSNALTNLGNLSYRRDRLDEAERFYRLALECDPEQPEALYNLGFLHFERDEIEPAITLFRQALRSDSSFADAHFNLAMALEEHGDRNAACAHWQHYLALEPTGSWADIAQKHLDEDPRP